MYILCPNALCQHFVDVLPQLIFTVIFVSSFYRRENENLERLSKVSEITPLIRGVANTQTRSVQIRAGLVDNHAELHFCWIASYLRPCFTLSLSLYQNLHQVGAGVLSHLNACVQSLSPILFMSCLFKIRFWPQ